MFEFDHPAFRQGFVPGVHLKDDGRLIDFTRISVAVLRCWPAPSGWRKFFRGQWHAFRPQINLRAMWVGPYRKHRDWIEASERSPMDAEGQLEIPFLGPRTERENRRRKAYHDFLLQIPEDIRTSLACFRCRQWHLLALAARVPGGLDLIRTGPALAMCLSSPWVFRKPPVQRPLRSARWLVKRPRTTILEWLSFPGTPSAARVLARVPARVTTIELLLYLRQALWDPEARERLGYLQRVNRGVVRVLSDPRLRAAVTPRFLEELSMSRRDDVRPESAYLLMDTLNMIETQKGGAPFVARSLRHLSEVHDDLGLRIARSVAERENRAFGTPPFPGTDSIMPISSSADLVAEAEAMHSCIASYADRILHGTAWVFRVFAPSRATALIVPAGQGWILREIRAIANRAVPMQTFDAVACYFRDAQDGLADNPMAEYRPSTC